MAWRPYENLIDGELDNRTPGKVTGWMRFYRRGKKPLRVTFDLEGDFHEDIRGKVIVLNNPEPSDKNADLDRKGTYMDGFARVQCGSVGDITAGLPLGRWTDKLAENLKAQLEVIWRESGINGAELEERRQQVDAEYREKIAAGELHYSYVDYPYIEWYSDDNGRVVLELEPSQIRVVDVQGVVPRNEKSPEELARDRKKRIEALGRFMQGMTSAAAEENRKAGGDGNVTGMVVG